MEFGILKIIIGIVQQVENFSESICFVDKWLEVFWVGNIYLDIVIVEVYEFLQEYQCFNGFCIVMVVGEFCFRSFLSIGKCIQ